MHFSDLIIKKRNGSRLSREEIAYFISGYVGGKIPDYQVSALLMAIWFTKMDPEETADLTMEMLNSGDVVNLSDIPGIKVDKHSTGGVADTTTLVVAPLVAACGLKVAKMSGRGLGHTGGTIDKLESIPGFSADVPMQRFVQIVEECGLSIISQTKELVPADKMLYSLRDVTGTVDNTSLIAASIMSKKLASGSDVIVLDIKAGNGAFMKRVGDAMDLAKTMVSIGKAAGKKTMGLVTDMNQPLGKAIGNALEVKEAIEILQGRWEGDLKSVSFALSARMLIAAGIARNEKIAMGFLDQALTSGAALKKLAQMISAHGGSPDVCEDTKWLPQAERVVSITAKDRGYITKIMADQVGVSALLLGAGRVKKNDSIDPAVGIWMGVRLGDYVEKGDVVAAFHVNDPKNLDEAVKRFQDAIIIRKNPPGKITLLYDTIE